MNTPLHDSSASDMSAAQSWLCLAWSGTQAGVGSTVGTSGGNPALDGARPVGRGGKFDGLFPLERPGGVGGVAGSPGGPDPSDLHRRHLTDRDMIVGRGQDATWSFVSDDQLSRLHARLFLADGKAWVEDLHSTNGTFVNGVSVTGPRHIQPGDVVRCGRQIFVLCLFDGLPSGGWDAARRMGLVGRYYGPGLLERAAEAAVSGAHILVSGESGTGKELLVRAIAEITGAVTRESSAGPSSTSLKQGGLSTGTRASHGVDDGAGAMRRTTWSSGGGGGGGEHSGPMSMSLHGRGRVMGRAGKVRQEIKLISQNCAAFANEEEARSTIFGVLSGVFSGVGARKGLIEEAEGGILHLDEVHELSIGVQRSLLRFVEDGIHRRVGDVGSGRKVRLRLVCTVNISVQSAIEEGILAFDLVNRLQQVCVPGLEERRPDIPEIFLYHLADAARSMGISQGAVRDELKTWHMEALASASYRQDNVRKLIRIANAVCAKMLLGWSAGHALDSVLGSMEKNNPVVSRKLSERTWGQDGDTPDDDRRGRRSVYEEHKPVILATFRACGGNLSKTVRRLSERGIRVSRRWLAIYLKRWGERR